MGVIAAAGRTIAVPLALAAAAALMSCADAPPEPTPTAVPAPSRHPTPAPAPASAGESTRASTSNELDLDAIAGAELGIAVGERSGGFSLATPAWSTIKVPLAIAALRVSPEMYPSARSAITVSDNTAAENLYRAAGPDAVNQVLAEARVGAELNTELPRPGFSTFGQTLLTPGQEAQLAGQLACLVGASDVLALMGEIDPSQAWGLGAVPGALYKGGWGPDESGAYQVRQLGLVPRGDGTFAAVAMTALPADGSFASGQALLTHAALRLAENAPSLPAAPCQP